MRMRSWTALVAAGWLALAGCGDDDGNGPAPDAADGPDAAAADAAPPDAPPAGTCLADLIDLDTSGQHVDNQIRYMGVVRAGPGMHDPLPGCTSGATRNEKAHKLTVATRSRVRAIVDADALNAVVYIRSACEDPSSELACGGAGFAEARDVTAGSVVYVVVDAAMVQQQPLPLDYTLIVVLDPVVTEGETCDPTTATNVCEAGTVCSIAGGSPVCATPLGGPTLTSLRGRVEWSSNRLYVYLQGSDPDGDVLGARGYLLDGDGAPLDFSGDGVADEFTFDADRPFAGNLTIDHRLNFRLSTGLLDLIGGARLWLIDSDGRESAELAAAIEKSPIVNGAGGACGPDPMFCGEELSCSGLVCMAAAAAEAACAAADASAPVGPGTYTTTIAAGGADLFEGTCYFSPYWGGESILRVEVPGPRHVRLTANTAVAPSSTMLDTYVYVRSSCLDPGSELACNDDTNPQGSDYRSRMIAQDLAPGTYYLFIDGSSEGDGYVASGPVGLTISTVDLKDPGEACAPATDSCWKDYVCTDAAGGGETVCTSLVALMASECAAAPVVTPGTSLTGQIAHTGINFRDAHCAYSPGWPEKFHLLTLTGKADVTATTNDPATNVDTTLYFLSACAYDAQVLACNDDVSGTNWRSQLTKTLPAGTYAVVVDLSSNALPDGSGMAPDPASYELTVTVKPVLGAGEVCDPTGMANRCDTGLVCDGTTMTCLPPP